MRERLLDTAQCMPPFFFFFFLLLFTRELEPTFITPNCFVSVAFLLLIISFLFFFFFNPEMNERWLHNSRKK